MESAPVPPWPAYEPDECAAALRVLQSGRVNYWTGDECRAFEREWAARVGIPHTLAMANGSVTLEAALRAIGVGPGAEVICSPRSFVASAMCVVNVGARPIFADVCPHSGNITAATMEAVRTPRTRAAIPVHLGGWPCDMDAMSSWAAAHSIALVEDCAQAHGATWNGAPVGSFGAAASWSFCQDKIITTAGEGGMVAFAQRAAWNRAWSMSQHGKDFDACAHAADGRSFRWLVHHAGTNWRMTELQAAVGRVQLRKLDAWLAARARNARIMHDALQSLPFLRLPAAPQGHAWYRFYAYTRPESGVSRDMLIRAVSAAGWPIFTGTCPEVYREPFFVEQGLAPPAPLSVAHELGETSLAFLVHPTISASAMRQYADGVAHAMASAGSARATIGGRA